MTEKRFKDKGFDNIKHYTETSMTEKQFEIICEDSSLVDVPLYVISNNKDTFDIYGSEKDAKKLCGVLNENGQLKKVAKEFTQNPTQHNLWKLRTVLNDGDGDD